MNTVKFIERSMYEYIKTLAEKGWETGFSAHFSDVNQVVQVENKVLARLLDRLNKKQPTVIPYFDNKKCFWLVTANNVQLLDKTIRRLGYFLLPSFAEFLEKDGIPKRRKFDLEKGGFNQLGQQLFPQGFYLFRSADTEKGKILNALDLWIDLEETKPSPSKKEKPSYFDLYQIFQENLKANEWVDAQKALDNIRRFSLSTADNISFLRIQLLAAQKEWGKIWDYPDYADLSKLTIPRNVRASMLSAFYWLVIQPMEEQNILDAIFQALDDYRSKLGRLLTGRFGIKQEEVLRIFAYLTTKDQNREGFKELQIDAQEGGLGELLSILEKRLPETPTSVENREPLELARLAITNNDFDRAGRFAARVSDLFDQAFLYIQIATLSGDQSVETIKKALQPLDTLSESHKEEFFIRYPQATKYLRYLENVVNQPEFPSVWDPITSDLRLKAWNLIMEFEIRQRKLVEIRYKQHFGSRWRKQIDPDLLDRWQRAAGNKIDLETASNILEYSFLSDLDKLTRRKWEFFQDVFGTAPMDKTNFKHGMVKIITIRNELAHIRAVKEDDLKNQIQICMQFILKLEKKLGSSMQIA